MANVSVSNTTGLYIGSGAASVLNNAQQLLGLLSNNGGVVFSLDPTTSNTKVQGNAQVPNYNNANVAAFLPTYTGNLVSLTGAVITSANITGAYFIGNGSQLTGLAATYGNANVAAFLPTYTGAMTSMTGAVTTTANITGAFILGNGSQLTGIVATSTYSNANVAAFLPTYNGSMTSMTGAVTTTANVSANYFIGNGSQLTGLGATYGNANVAAFLPTYTGAISSMTGDLVTTANVQGAFLLGNGSQITGITTNYSNTNVAAFLPTYTGAISSMTGAVTTTANITGAYFLGNGSQLTGLPTTYSNTNVAAFLPTYTGAMTSMTGAVTTTANITGAYFLGNGSQLTGIADNYSNVNVAAFLPTYTGAMTSMTGAVTTTANITGAFILGNGSQLTGIAANYSNVNVAAYLPTYTGNLGAGNLNIVSSGVVYTPTVQATSSAGGTLKNATGTTQAAWGAGGGDNFTVSVSTNLTGANAQVDISPTGTGHVHIKPTGTGSLEIAPTNVGSMNKMIIGNVTPQAANVTTLGASGNVTASYFIGNGSQLTGITANYSDANVAAFLPTYTGNLVSLTGAVTTTANVTGAYILGNGSQLTGITDNYSNTNVAAFLPTYSGLLGGTLTTNAQPNITSVGTLSSLTVTGNVTPGGISTSGNIQAAGIGATGNIQATFFLGNGSQLTGITDNYSNVNVSAFLPTYAGLLGGTLTNASQPNITSVGTLTSITTSGNLSAVNANITATVFASNIVTLGSSGNITGADYITANFFVGNGSLLTGISGAGTYGDANVAAFLPTYAGNLGGNLTTAAQTNITRVGNLTTANVTGSVLAFGNVGNQYFIGHSINNAFANTATYADVKIAGWQYSSPTGTNVAAAAMTLTGNIQLTRTNDNNNARVRPLVITGLFDANGFSSSIGISPFSNSGSDTNLVIGISRMPAVVQQFNIVNSQATAVNISSAGGMVTTAGISNTNQRANVNYMVGQTVEVGLFANDTTSRIINATAYRADFATLTSNTANVGNRIAFECIDSTANIKIAGNIVSTAANIVANGATINGRATITGNVALGGVTSLVGYTETVTSASYTSGNVFSPNVQSATIQTLTLTQDTTINQFTDALAGQSCQLILTQDGTGNRLLTSNMKFAGGSKTLSTAAGAIDVISVLYDGTTYYARLTTGYA